jgi:hypothetical protein
MVNSPQSLAPESPRDSIERAEQETGGREQHESRQEWHTSINNIG